MPDSAVAAPTMAIMHDWKSMESTGRHQRLIQPGDDLTTLVEAGKLFIVKVGSRSRAHFLFAVCGNDIGVYLPRYTDCQTIEELQGQLVSPDEALRKLFNLCSTTGCRWREKNPHKNRNQSWRLRVCMP